ncbi:energy-coupling factor transporter transmembrane component T family protein [Fervidobacterium thailandense]|uniref:Cobalt ABC transporter permease n=1 Tax=Fervidobacterium thailandense TaxID=1008305 RepID=A0A1E3G3T3_9BACT|nr:energy-coupling factor transporter transmembrane component T [Fervidobacterium thailandense]ODN30931.1 cobalt ABC transporter permease [Fervidobacterium thailandense]
MRVLSLYVERDTLVHRLAPFTKLMFALTSTVVTFLFPSIVVGGVFLGLSVFLTSVAKVLKYLTNLLFVVLVLSISIVVIQGMFYVGNRTSLFSLFGITFYSEGLQRATVLVLRLFTMISAFGVLVLTTCPSDLIDDLVRRGLSPRFGYVLASVLQIVPQMLSTATRIIDAQRSRGLEMEGSFLKKLRAFFALIGPLVLGSLVEARERALALEMRGFAVRTKRTFLKEFAESKLDKFLVRLFQFILYGSITWRIVSWIVLK